MSAEPLTRAYWLNVPALGKWVPIADVMRAGGFNMHSTTRIASLLRDAGARIRSGGMGTLSFVHRDDLHLMANVAANAILARLRRAGADRGDLLDEISRPEFEDMDLCDIIAHLANDPKAVNDALADLGGDE